MYGIFRFKANSIYFQLLFFKKKLTSTFFIRRLELLTLRMKLEPPNQRVVSKFFKFLNTLKYIT